MGQNFKAADTGFQAQDARGAVASFDFIADRAPKRQPAPQRVPGL